MLCTNIFISDTTITIDKKCVFGPKQRLKFLIILPDDDFLQKSCLWFWSKIDLLQQNARMFPGKLEILNKSQLHIGSHQTGPNAEWLSNRLYVRLPKEKVYVLIEEFPAKYIKSQLEELGLLLLHLHAEEVKIRNISTNPIFEKPLATVHPGVEDYVKEMGAIEHSCVEIKYDEPTENHNLNKTQLFFYCAKWQPIIDARRSGKLYDEYIFEYIQPCFMEEDFLAFLRSCGVHVPIYDVYTRKFELQYEIFYYVDDNDAAEK